MQDTAKVSRAIRHPGPSRRSDLPVQKYRDRFRTRWRRLRPVSFGRRWQMNRQLVATSVTPVQLSPITGIIMFILYFLLIPTIFKLSVEAQRTWFSKPNGIIKFLTKMKVYVIESLGYTSFLDDINGRNTPCHRIWLKHGYPSVRAPWLLKSYQFFLVSTVSFF